MPQKLHHKKKVYYSCTTDGGDFMFKDPPFPRRKKKEMTKLSQ
jgi:hypothetical protein